jgi:hypothetical protein
MNRDILHLVQHGAPSGAARLVQIFLNLILTVDSDCAATGQIVHVDAMAGATEADIDPVVDKPLALHAIAYADFGHEIDHALFQHTGTHPVNHILFAA